MAAVQEHMLGPAAGRLGDAFADAVREAWREVHEVGGDDDRGRGRVLDDDAGREERVADATRRDRPADVSEDVDGQRRRDVDPCRARSHRAMIPTRPSDRSDQC